MRAHLILSVSALLFAACDVRGPEVPGRKGAAEEVTVPQRDVKPADFAIESCSGPGTNICLFARAGGKRLLFGAPAGVGNRIAGKELARLDGLFLYSLRSEDIEGLDEVRNISWQAGRPGPLSVSGPAGLSSVIDGLNRAYEISDALIFIEDGAPAGGFDAALLETAHEVMEDTVVFYTGDLKVEVTTGMNDRLSYRVDYRDVDETWHTLVIQPCGAPDIARNDIAVDEVSRVEIACIDGQFGENWPFEGTRFLHMDGG